MPNVLERQQDILSIISELDISPTMYSNAVEKYKAITAYLESYGIEAEMYPQGSFAFGTVVRPTSKSADANYDLDFICQIKGDRSSHTPSELRKILLDALKASGIYEGKLEIWDECFTIEYADVGKIGFTIDIVPATDESEEKKQSLLAKSSYPNLINTAVAIPKHNGNHNYTWITNNPRGFRQWFDEINKPFLEAGRNNYRNELFKRHSRFYASVEEIPHALDRSALQRVIQLLKYHRNVYYDKLPDGDDIKPISAIINVLVTEISKAYNPECSVFELLEYVLKELEIYAQHLAKNQKEFVALYGARNVISHNNGVWYIANPANPEDNLANKWNENPRIPKTFFMWIKVVTSDLIDSLQQDDKHFRTTLDNGFGSKAVTAALGKKYMTTEAPRLIIKESAPKPYCKI